MKTEEKESLLSNDHDGLVEDTPPDEISFDDIVINYLGEFGIYQKFLYALVTIPAITTAFPTMIPVFVLGEHLHRCAIPGMPNDTFISEEITEENIFIWENGTRKLINRYVQCDMYLNGTLGANGTFTDGEKESCSKWVYDKSIYQSTMVSDLNLVCDKSIYTSHASMTYFGGVLIGGLIMGYLSDVYGRKPVLCITLASMFAFNLATVWVDNFYLYLFFRFMHGFSDSAYWGAAMVIGLELVGPSKRKLTGLLIEVAWCIGEFTLIGLAFWLRDWRDLQLAISVPMALFLGYYWMIPESPRWLMTQGRHEEAFQIIKTAAKYNKVNIPEKVLQIPKSRDDNDTEEDSWGRSMVALLKSPRLLLRAANIGFNWFVVNLGYYGLSYNVAELGGDVYENFTFSVTVELLGYIACILLLDRIGRRIMHCSSMLVGGVGCLCTIFTTVVADESPQWVNIMLSNIGKLGVSAAYGDIFVIASETFPTKMRSFVLGSVSILGQFGAMSAPYIADLGLLIDSDFGRALPLVIFGSAMVTAGLVALALPETLNKKLPDTIEEAIALGKSPSVYQQKYNTFTKVIE